MAVVPERVVCEGWRREGLAMGALFRLVENRALDRWPYLSNRIDGPPLKTTEFGCKGYKR